MLKTITIDVNDNENGNRFVVILSTPDQQEPLVLDYYNLSEALATARIFAMEHKVGYTVTFEAVEASKRN